VSATAATPGLADLDGLPFLDDAFAGGRLLAMTAAVRHVAARRRGIACGIAAADADVWLGPARALALSTTPTPMPALPLPGSRGRQVTGALTALGSVMPPWRPLLRLPVRYARLYPAGGAISASCRGWPQHVLLADEAFATGRELREQVLHELAHQWLYLIEGIWPLQAPGAASLTLPSGTRGRSPAEVLGAAHVAATLLRLYRRTATAWAANRAGALAAYGTRCLELARLASSDLTTAGTMIAQRLEEAL
jgi:hypothetical protein